MGLSLEEWFALAILVLVIFVVGLVVASPFIIQVPPAPYSLPTPLPTPTPTPKATPTPTPSPTSTQTLPPTPTPEPSATPEPTPSPSPTPAWMGAGYLCEVPDRLLGEHWAEEYKFQCACLIRGKWDLGPDFSVWEGCYSTTSSGWRRESCECVATICAEKPGLC